MRLANRPRLQIQRRGSVHEVVGELDLATAPALQRSLERAGGGIVCLDLSGVSFIDSTGVLALLEAAKSLDPKSCLILHEPRPQAARLFELLGLMSLSSNLHVVDGHERQRSPG